MFRKAPLAKGLLTLVFLGVTASAFENVSGAIFTTTMNGDRVNANHYPTKCGATGVWLDGGPGPNAPQGAAGLDDGDYYFQVTDPSGKTLLSTDAVIFRQFRVSGGIITGLSGSGNHNTGLDSDHGAVTIELCQFLDTPNPGGVYKVWVTPVGKFDGNPNLVDNSCGRGCFHGFIPAWSKTDNFKVKGGAGGACLTMLKVIDTNGNGYADYPDDPLRVWPITITDPLGTSNTFWSGLVKECTFAQLVPGLYTVTEGATDGSGNYEVTLNLLDGSYLRNPDVAVLVRIKNNQTREVVFGNTPTK
jgi:hypothetical protein